MSNLTDLSPEDQTERERLNAAYQQARRDAHLANEHMRLRHDVLCDHRAACLSRKIAALGIKPGDAVDITHSAHHRVWRSDITEGFYLGVDDTIIVFAPIKKDGTPGKRRVLIDSSRIETLTKRETQEGQTDG